MINRYEERQEVQESQVGQQESKAQDDQYAEQTIITIGVGKSVFWKGHFLFLITKKEKLIIKNEKYNHKNHQTFDTLFFF